MVLMPEKWQVTDLQPLYLSGANKQRIEEEGSSASYPDPSSSHPAVALLLVPSLTQGTPPASPPTAHTITRSAAGAYLQTQGGANHAQATWACPSALIHLCAACPSFSLFCLTRAPRSPSLIQMYPPHLTQWHFQPMSLPPLLKLKAGHSRLAA